MFPHRLMHTAATQLLNAGCRITSIQKFLGHKELSTTMIYARVYDQTVVDDYYMAMERIEQRLDLIAEPEKPIQNVNENERGQLLAFAVQLAQPELSQEVRLDIAEQMSLLLSGQGTIPINEDGRKQTDIQVGQLLPSPVLLGVT